MDSQFDHLSHGDAYRRARNTQLDQMALELWRVHPDLDTDRDCAVLTWEDIQELKWLDCEIAIEHTLGVHKHGCPPGCLYLIRSNTC